MISPRIKSNRKFIHRMRDRLCSVYNFPSDLVWGSTQLSPFINFRAPRFGRFLTADAGTWESAIPGGASLALQSGTAPTIDAVTAKGSMSFRGNEHGILYKKGGYHQAAASTSYELTTEDFLFEVILTSYAQTTDVCLFSKYDSVNKIGYQLWWMASSGTHQFIIGKGDGATTATITSHQQNAPLQLRMQHILIYGNRDYANIRGSGFAENGSHRCDGTNISTCNVDLTNSGKFTIGADSNGASPCDAGIMLIHGFKSASLLANTDIQSQIATLSARRVRQLYTHLRDA